MKKKSASALISDLKRKTRKAYNSEDKIRIIIEGMRGETTIAELCRKESIHQANYYKWSKDIMEAGKRRLSGDTMREANTSEVHELKGENGSLKELVAELSTNRDLLTMRKIMIRQCKYSNNIVEQDHRNIKRRISIDTGFKEFESAKRTLAGIEVVNIIRKDQIADSRKTTFKTFCSLAA